MFEIFKSKHTKRSERDSERDQSSSELWQRFVLLRAAAHLPDVRPFGESSVHLISGTGPGAGEAFLSVLDEIDASIITSTEDDRHKVRAEIYASILSALIDRSQSGIVLFVDTVDPVNPAEGVS